MIMCEERKCTKGGYTVVENGIPFSGTVRRGGRGDARIPLIPRVRVLGWWCAGVVVVGGGLHGDPGQMRVRQHGTYSAALKRRFTKCVKGGFTKCFKYVFTKCFKGVLQVF